MTTFVAIDVETANPDLSSICAIGIVSFLNGVEVGRIHMLANPEDYFDPVHVGIHSISQAMVANSPKLSDVYPIIAKALSGRVVVHHMPFDRVAISRLAHKHGYQPFECFWIDTAKVARRTWNEIQNAGYGLKNIARKLHIEFEHHNPTEDAFVAGTIMMRAIADSGVALEDWISKNQRPISDKDYSPSLKHKEGEIEGTLSGETIVFTGALLLPRHEAAALAFAAGADVAKDVSKGTTILFVGNQDARRLGDHEKSAKHRKAEGLVAKGHDIRILTEDDFLALIAR